MKKRILIIDDHDFVRAGISAVLEPNGEYVVYGKPVTYDSAIRTIAAWPPDVVIIDPYYRDMESFDVVKNIKAKHPQLPVLVLTTRDSIDYINRAMRDSASGYMLKSSPVKDIAAALETILDNRIYLHPDVSHRLLRDSFSENTEDNGNGNGNSHLTRRQEQVLRLIAEGKTTRQIAATLGLSVKTVESHRVLLMSRLGIHHVPGLVKYALKHGYVSYE